MYTFERRTSTPKLALLKSGVFILALYNKGFVSNLPMASKSHVRSLCRSLLRAGRQFPDYNIREYTKRRTLDGFRMNKTLTDQSKVNEIYAEGKAQLEVVERVLKVYLAYPPKTKNIMELKLQ